MSDSPLVLKDEFLAYEMPLSWESVWDFWRANEESLPHWTAYWRAQGYKSWEQWRTKEFRPFQLETLQWHYYRVELPYISIPAFRGGPFYSWQKRFYGGMHLPTFRDMADQHHGIREDAGIANYLIDFPESTVLVGVVLEEKVVILEGMHRCAALSLVARKGSTLDLRHDIRICLAAWPEGRPLVP